MGCSTYTFMLDLHSKKGQISLPVTQGDTNRELRISFSDGVKPYVLGAGSVAMMSIVRPTGTETQEFCNIEDDGARVVYPFTEHTCPVAGLHTCEVVLINSEGKQIASPRFSIDAAPKLVSGNDVEIPDEDISAIDAILKAEAQRQAAEALREANTTAALKEINEVKTSIETMRDNGEFEGESAYEISVRHGYKGTEEQWDQEVRGDFSERLEDAKQELAETVSEANEDYLGYIDELIGDGYTSIGLILPETAEVGQFLKVSSITENGKVASLEAISISAPIPLTQKAYDELVAAGTLEKDALYMIIEEDSV